MAQTPENSQRSGRIDDGRHRGQGQIQGPIALVDKVGKEGDKASPKSQTEQIGGEQHQGRDLCAHLIRRNQLQGRNAHPEMGVAGR